MSTIYQIPVSIIHPHPKNPRQALGDLTELTDSIRAQGIRQNLLIVPHGEKAYRCVIGHRRLAAAAAAGLETVPAVIDETLTEAQQLELMLVENLQRVDLTPIEEAHGYQDMLDLGFTVKQVATQTGRSQSTIRARVDLLQLPEAAQAVVGSGQGSLEDAAALLEFQDDPEATAQLVDALGTSDFDWVLQRERSSRERRAREAEQIAAWEERGVPRYDGPVDSLGAPVGYATVVSLADDEPLPDGIVWCRTLYGVEVFVPKPEAVVEEDDTARAEMQRQREQDAEDAATAWALRDAFVARLRARRITYQERDIIAARVAHMIKSAPFLRPQTVDPSLSPHHQLIELLHGWNGDSRWAWADLRQGRGPLLDWYTTLISLGYVPSSVEQAAFDAGSEDADLDG